MYIVYLVPFVLLLQIGQALLCLLQGLALAVEVTFEEVDLNEICDLIKRRFQESNGSVIITDHFLQGFRPLCHGAGSSRGGAG